MFDLHMSGSDSLLTGRRNCFSAISMPILGKLSFPNMLLSCPDVIKKWGIHRNPYVGSNWENHRSNHLDNTAGESAKECSCFLLDGKYFKQRISHFVKDVLFQQTDRAGGVHW